jgi:CHAT domain-containing protein/Tfp pilus assembly protein PilF
MDHCNAAVAITREIGAREQEAATLAKLGSLYITLGEKQRALEQFVKALSLARATGTRIWEGTVLNNIGLVFYESGEYPKALANYDLALPLRRAVGDRTGESATLSNIGRSYEALGQKALALDYFGRALDVARAAESPRWQAGSLSNMAWVYAVRGEQQRALEQFNQALSLYRNMGDLRGEGSVLYGIARADRDLGDFTAALNQIESALKIVETLRNKVANPQLRASYFSSVREYYEFYIDLLMQLDKNDSSKGYAGKALGISERSRARSLLETLQEATANIRRGVDPHLLEQEHSLQQLLDGKTERQMYLVAGHNEKQAATVKKEIEDLLAEYQEVEVQIRASSREYAALTQPEPFDLAEIQKEVLDADTVLLEYSLGSERSYLWAVTANSLTSFQLPKVAEIDAAARRVYDLLTARNRNETGENEQQRSARLKQAELQYPEAALALSKLVLGPVAQPIRGKRLAIVADGALQYVPFGVLPTPTNEDNGAQSNPLVLDHEVVNLPSASVLGLSLRVRANRKSAPKAVAVLADPVFDRSDARVRSSGQSPIRQDDAEPSINKKANSWVPDLTESRMTRSVAEVGIRGVEAHLPRLVFTRQEAKSIIDVTPADQGLEALDFDASWATATSSELGQYRMIHFATHGLLDSSHPELSGLVLSLVDKQGKPVHGFLDLEDVYNLNLSAELVTLSACETGLGKEVRGEGLVGLTRGFMYAGAQRVVASLWRVDDIATAELMGRFYRGMLRKGLQPTVALRQAQVQMWEQKRWAAPYYWGAFTIQGQWR